MDNPLTRIVSACVAWRRDRRRQRNLRAATRTGVVHGLPTGLLPALLAGALALGGAMLIWRHAEGLAAQADGADAPALRPAALQAVLPGARFEVPRAAGVQVLQVAGGTLLIASGLEPGPVVRIDLCSRPLPLQVGYRFSDVAGEVALRHALLAQEGSDMPALTLSAMPGAAQPALLRVRWRERGAEAARWTSDADGASMRALGWLTWAGGAVRIERRAARACAPGEMVVQAFHLRRAAVEGERPAEVIGFPLQGAPVALRLPPGRYEVPAAAAAPQEDAVLFHRLQARGLLRLRGDGLLALAPPDLAQWLSAAPGSRAVELVEWRGMQADDDMRALLKRLYRQADGAYVRQQVDLFNAERRLLAWRLGAGTIDGVSVQVQAPGGAALPQSGDMPPVAVRLFSDLPQGWQAWRRPAHWVGDGTLSLLVALPQPATGRERVTLLIAGRLAEVSRAGAAVTAADACTGSACANSADVQSITLRPHAGVRQIVLRVAALDVSRALHPGDQQYRHIRVADGALSWQAIHGNAWRSAHAGAGQGGALIADRSGRALWADDQALPDAQRAGLAPLLGIAPGHASSLAGMLARASGVQGHVPQARLTLDLPLQGLAQAIIECQGLRGGAWSGDRCEGGASAPAQRRAGLVLLDAENGDILAGAGAGGPSVTAANWREARDFDRANPARSALRLPAWQHDGGAHSSPGSAFKMVSALGLEMAARRDRTLDAMLGGLPLQDMDHLAAQRGYGFRSDAATYPIASPAHVTNYREQTLQRRAEAGRLGLAQSLAYSVNTWFAWTAELSDRTLQSRPDGGAPGLRALEEGAIEAQRPIAAAARALGFGQPMRLDGGLLPASFPWKAYDALQSTPSRIDPIDTRHELRQMAIGLRMQATPLQMAVAAAAIGSGRAPQPRLLLELDGRAAATVAGQPLPARLDRIRAGMKGVIDSGTAASAFAGPAFAAIRPGLYGKTGTAPVSEEEATVWFTGWLEPGTLPGQRHRLAFAAFVSHSQLTGGGHAAPMVAALLRGIAVQNGEQTGKRPLIATNGRAGLMRR